MKKHRNALINYFLKGLSIVIPFWGTIALSWYAISKISSHLDSLIQYIPLISWIVKIPGLSIVATCVAVLFMGSVGSTFLIAPLVSWLEYVVLNIPILNILYSYIKESTKFEWIDKLDRPVLVKIDYQECEAYKIGFLTQEKLHALSLMEGEVAVYLPHAYAFSGEVTIFPKKNVKALDISSTEALRLVLTGGLAEIKRPLITSSKRKDH